MNMLHKIFFASAIIAMISVAACFGGGSSGSADSFVTQADFNALKAQLRVQVVQLHPALSRSGARTMAFGGMPTAVPAAATVAPASLGTSCGYDAPYPRTTLECIVDSQGVTAVVPYPQGGSYQTIYPIFYDQAGCVGNAFVQLGPQTLTEVPTSGAHVFRVDAFSKGALDASTYYHVSAGAAFTNVNPQSESQGDGNCIATSFVNPVGMIPITPGVAGTWAAAPTGPLAAGTPQ